MNLINKIKIKKTIIKNKEELEAKGLKIKYNCIDYKRSSYFSPKPTDIFAIVVNKENKKTTISNETNTFEEALQTYLSSIEAYIKENKVPEKPPISVLVYNFLCKLLPNDELRKPIDIYQNKIDKYSYLKKLTEDKVFQKQEINSLFHNISQKEDWNITLFELEDKENDFYVVKLNDINEEKVLSIEKYEVKEEKQITNGEKIRTRNIFSEKKTDLLQNLVITPYLLLKSTSTDEEISIEYIEKEDKLVCNDKNIKIFRSINEANEFVKEKRLY